MNLWSSKTLQIWFNQVLESMVRTRKFPYFATNAMMANINKAENAVIAILWP